MGWVCLGLFVGFLWVCLGFVWFDCFLSNSVWFFALAAFGLVDCFFH